MQHNIAVPTKGKEVDSHFGHCDCFSIYTVENDNVLKEELFTAPKGCGCKSNLAGILKEKNVDLMLAGNMGQGALNKLTGAGINVIRGCSGNVMDVVGTYLKGELNDSGESCSNHNHHGNGHGHGHQCNHDN